MPPSSIVARFIEAAAAASTFLPVPIDPVSDTFAMRPSLAKQRAGASVPVNDVEGAVGKAGLGVDFGKLDRRRRRHLRCLEDHRVAAGERRRRLPARNLDRIVPSADPGAHPERFPARVDEGIVERDLLAAQRAGDAGEIFDAIGPARDIHGLGLLDRLAGVLNLELGKLAVAGAQDVRRLAEHTPALGARERRPAQEPALRRRDGSLDLGFERDLDARNHLPVRRIDVVEDGGSGHAGVTAIDIARKSMHGGTTPLGLTAIEPFGGNRARSEATQRTQAATTRRTASRSDD